MSYRKTLHIKGKPWWTPGIAEVATADLVIVDEGSRIVVEKDRFGIAPREITREVRDSYFRRSERVEVIEVGA